MRAIRAAVFLMALVGMLSPLCLPQAVTGLQPFNSYGGGPFDAVNLGNLNVHFAIPIFHKAGRGIPFAYDLAYESTIWTPVTSGSTKAWLPAQNWGWSTPWAGTTGYVTYLTTTSYCYGSNGYPDDAVATTSNWQYIDRGGVVHHFTGGQIFYGDHVPACTGTNVNSFTSQATDGSGLTLDVPNSADTAGNLYVQDPSGNFFYPPVNPTNNTQQQATQGPDHNGNKITLNSSNGQITDTLGQIALTISGTNPVSYTYSTPGGTGSAAYKLNYSTYNIKTNFGCSGVSEYTSTNVSLVSSITLPDSTSYTFTYEPTQGFSGYYTGRLASVTIPTGGKISYSYPLTNSGTKNGINCADGTAPAVNSTTPGLTRTLTPGGTWTHIRTKVSGNHWQTKVTSPPGDDTVIDFMEDGTTANSTYSFYETQRQSYQGASSGGNLLLTTVACWNGNGSNCTTTAVNSPITQKAVTLQYPSNGLQSKVVTLYSGALVTETDRYAYASGTPTNLAQKTTVSYGTFINGCTPLGNNISNVPCQIAVTDGSGNFLSITHYTYDETAVQVTNGTPQLSSVTGSRGNATTISRLVSGNTYLATHFSYYDTGNVYQATDVNGAITTYNYPDATSTCGNSFPISVTLPISGLSSLASTTWNCAGGVATTVKDVNGNSTTTSFTDPNFWRPASVQDPIGATTSFTYNAYSSGTLANVDSKVLFNSGNSVAEQLATVNQFGQLVYSQQHEGPSSGNWDSTQAVYDTFLRPYQSAMPCVTSTTSFTAQGQACPNAAITNGTFDALGRITQTTDGGGGYIKYYYNQNDVKTEIGPVVSGENLKLKQLESDALGRLTSVCEITQLTGYVQCGQTNAYNGYWTSYAYSVNSSHYPTVTVTQGPSNSQQSRVYNYDLLGRLLSENNPENGTTQYFYDNDPGTVGAACSTVVGSNWHPPYNGDPVKKYDAKGNTVCYTYDALHRVTGNYYAGPDSGNTPIRTFVYDNATFNNTAMSNAKGKLAEAYTGSSGSKLTDEFFSYSVRGELTDTWECTPHSGTNGCSSVSNYYHVTAGFWENGALKTLSSSISSLPTQTYGVDAMGRPNAVSAGSGQNPVTATSYDLTNFKTTVTYGSQDSDVVYLDAATGRITKYVFNVGSNSDTGQMTWNQNGSLGTMQITDTIPNTSDTQTCNYSHDDLARIGGVNCLNGSTNDWNQTFTYDAFGNITKTTSGPGISFQPTYATSSNWITALPGINTTTDANGQMTYDGTHNYSWDAAGKMVSVDTITLTHDAFGRTVEKNVSGTYTQFVYAPSGKKFALMNGQTLQKAFIPLPGGAKAVYTSSGLAYYRHHDHLGSSRLATTPSRTLYSSTAYAPYGEPYAQVGTTDLSFTGKDQDTVSGMHDYPLRNFVSVQGRWLSPDPAGLTAVEPTMPQTWNRYAYVSNNPLVLIDDDGDYQGCYDPGWGGTCEDSGPTSLFGPDGRPCAFIDGAGGSCGMAQALVGSDVGLQCPDNQCWVIGADGRPGYYWASAYGTGDYFNYSGSGALFFSLEAAGNAAALYYWDQSTAAKREFGGNIYAEDGVFSFSPGQEGAPCSENVCNVAVDISDIPDGAQLLGIYHTHPDVGQGSDDFSARDVETAMNNNPQLYSFLGTGSMTEGYRQVLMLDPNSFNLWNAGISNIPPVCVLSGPSLGMQPCH